VKSVKACKVAKSAPENRTIAESHDNITEQAHGG